MGPAREGGCPSEAEDKSNGSGMFSVAGSTGMPWDPSASVGMTYSSSPLGLNQKLVLRAGILYCCDMDRWLQLKKCKTKTEPCQ